MDLTPIGLIREGFPGFNADNVKPFFEELMVSESTGSPAVVAAYVDTAVGLFPDAVPEQIAEAVSSAWDVAELSGVGGNSYHLAAYAVGRHILDLAELVRRARHRDGSTAALVTGHDAIALLEAVAEPLAPELKGLGFDLSNLQTGNFPAAGTTQASGVAETVSAAPEAAAAESPAAPPPLPAFNDPLPTPPAGLAAYPNRVLGQVEITSLAGAPLCVLPLLACELFSQTLQRAIRALLIPIEGFVWVDEMEQVKASLVLLDPVLAAKMSAPERSGELAQSLGQAKCWLQGDVVQQTDPAAPGGVGSYTCVLYEGSGFVEVGRSDGFLEAKRILAENVRNRLPPEFVGA